VLTGVLVAGTLAALVEGGFLQQVLGPNSPGSGLSSAAAGRDPLEYRSALLAKKPRHLRALKAAAEVPG